MHNERQNINVEYNTLSGHFCDKIKKL